MNEMRRMSAASVDSQTPVDPRYAGRLATPGSSRALKMSLRLRALHGVVFWIAVMAGCASPPGRLQAPKTVSGVELAPYAIIEECVPLEPGERIAYRFVSRLPVAFNIHFHEDNAVIMPVSRDGTTSESGDFAADRKELYCLMWEAGAGGSVLDYRVSPWPRRQ
jgi:hypothetical protein